MHVVPSHIPLKREVCSELNGFQSVLFTNEKKHMITLKSSHGQHLTCFKFPWKNTNMPVYFQSVEP